MPLIQFLSKEEIEARKAKTAATIAQSKAIQQQTEMAAAVVGQTLGDKAHQLSQEAEKVRIKYQDWINKLIEQNAKPEVIQQVVGKMNQEIYNRWAGWKTEVDSYKQTFQKLGDENGLKSLEQLEKIQPFTFYNIEPTEQGNFVVQEINPDGTVLSTFKFDTPQQYKQFVESSPDIRAMEANLTPAGVRELEQTAELLGMAPQQYYQQQQWLKQQQLKPSEQRMIEWMAWAKGIPVDEALEEYKGWKMSIDLTAVQKNDAAVNKMARQALEEYNNAVPEQFRVQIDEQVPLASAVDIDMSAIKDPAKRAKVQAKLDRFVINYLKTTNPQGWSAAVKKIQEVNKYTSSLARAVKAADITMKKDKVTPNFVKKWLYNMVGKWVPVQAIPGLDKFLNNADIDRIKNFQFTLNMLLKVLSGTAVTQNEMQRFVQATASLSETDPNILRGMLNIAQMARTDMDSMKAILGDVPYKVKFGQMDHWVDVVTGTVEKLMRQKGIEPVPSLSLYESPEKYMGKPTGKHPATKSIPVKAYTKKQKNPENGKMSEKEKPKPKSTGGVDVGGFLLF